MQLFHKTLSRVCVGYEENTGKRQYIVVYIVLYFNQRGCRQEYCQTPGSEFSSFFAPFSAKAGPFSLSAFMVLPKPILRCENRNALVVHNRNLRAFSVELHQGVEPSKKARRTNNNTHTHTFPPRSHKWGGFQSPPALLVTHWVTTCVKWAGQVCTAPRQSWGQSPRNPRVWKKQENPRWPPAANPAQQWSSVAGL